MGLNTCKSAACVYVIPQSQNIQAVVAVVMAVALLTPTSSEAKEPRTQGRTAQKVDSVSAKVVRAEAFELVDRDGNARGSWETLPSGAIALTIRDERGTPRTMLSLMPDGVAGLVLFDSKGRPKGILATRKENGSSLSLMDSRGKVRGEFSVGDDGKCALALSDSQGEQRAVLSSMQEDRAGLMVFDSKGLPAAHLGMSDGTKAVTLYGGRDHEIKLAAFVDNDANSSLHLYDKNGKQRGVWAATEEGAGISLFDSAERSRGVIGTTPEGDTGFLIFDERGKVRIRAPKDFDLGPETLRR